MIVSKYCDHLPLHRQSDIYARESVEIDRSVMAGLGRHMVAQLEPLAERIARHVRAGAALHADDTKTGAPAPLIEVACWAHARRKIYDVHVETKSPRRQRRSR